MVRLLILLLSTKVKLTGSTAVAVLCESCGRKYYYRLKRTVWVECSNRERERQILRYKLRQRLDRDVDPVPCPHCGWYQEEMVPLLRRPRLRWMVYLGVAAVVPIPFLLLAISFYIHADPLNPMPPRWFAVLCGFGIPLCLLTAITWLGLRGLLVGRYDPNDPETEEERVELGRSRSLTREEAAELLGYEFGRERR